MLASISPSKFTPSPTWAIITATTALQKEEDFAWEDEEDDTAGADRTETQTPMDQSELTPTLGVTLPEATTTPETKPTDSGGGPGDKRNNPTGLGAGGTSSPRESSEDSYDLVSTRSGNASGTALAVPGLASVLEGSEEKGRKGVSKKEGDEDDSGDSDWE
jgi:hypothetical protein